MHWYTYKSLLDTLGSAVEQLAVCLGNAWPLPSKQVSSRGQSTTVMSNEIRCQTGARVSFICHTM